MEIIKTNANPNDKRALYKLTRSKSIMVQDSPADVSVPVKLWALYNDPKETKDGDLKDQHVLSFVTDDGTKYSTISSTFVREFMDIVDIMDGEEFAILFIHGTTKGGRDFVSCELDCDFIA